MKNFTYYRPATPEQAVALLESSWGNTELLAGGTDLLDLQKEYVAQPSRVVSLTGGAAPVGIQVVSSGAGEGTPPQTMLVTERRRAILPSRRFITREVVIPGTGGGAGRQMLQIGAGTTLAAIASNANVKSSFPGLAEAAGQVGGPQIRNMGTLGGNLCQRNRCWYFRDEHTNCLLKSGTRCFALDGENRYHAIFTQNHRCVIVNPSTLAPVLVALGAVAEVLGPSGKRTVEVARLYKAPQGNNEREHTLAPNEVILSVSIPMGASNASYEVRHKQAYDWPLVQAAAAFSGSAGRASNVRIVLGHVAPTPTIAEAAARAVEGQPINEQTATAAGRAAGEGARPLAQNAYKVKLVEVAVKRALLIAADARRYWEA